jgi:hypothetical protein
MPQTTSEEDWVKRATFCEEFITLKKDQTLDKYIILSDEARFHLCATANREYADEAAKIMMPVLKSYMTHQKVMYLLFFPR